MLQFQPGSLDGPLPDEELLLFELEPLSERAKVVSLLFAATLLTVGVFLRVGS
ncbi:hypothetical protein [Rhizobium sp. F40D2]|uniref:hypothetical protein n=1 Tax=Rhizobium sp. F40D2 TaxID=3453141 RepID=UPI003F203B42